MLPTAFCVRRKPLHRPVPKVCCALEECARAPNSGVPCARMPSALTGGVSSPYYSFLPIHSPPTLRAGASVTHPTRPTFPLSRGPLSELINTSTVRPGGALRPCEVVVLCGPVPMRPKLYSVRCYSLHGVGPLEILAEADEFAMNPFFTRLPRRREVLGTSPVIGFSDVGPSGLLARFLIPLTS